MSQARVCVTFSTLRKERFPWPEGFQDASNDEIALLICETQWALYSLSAERLRRETQDGQPIPEEISRKEQNYNELIQTVEKAAADIERLGEIPGAQRCKLSKAKPFLNTLDKRITTNELEKKAKLANELCWQTLRWTDVNLTLLLIASIGRKWLSTLTTHHAASLFAYLYKQKKGLTSRVGTSLSEFINFDLHQGKKGRSHIFFASDAC